jgi:hypothetical protein
MSTEWVQEAGMTGDIDVDNIQDFAEDAEASKDAADTSAAAAATSASNALTSANNASESASNASASSVTATNKASEATASASSAATSATAASTSATAAAASETAAETAQTAAETAQTLAGISETNASTSATSASTSATAAAASATSASGSATTATTKATEASTSATAAAASATAAAASETAASASETAAAASETAAAASETAAAASETAAAASESAASTSETNAAASATSAASSASAAQAAEDAALAALDSFDDRYLGQKASDPTTDNDGNALVAGALYFNTTDSAMKVYEGSSWVAAYASLSGALLQANNLSDLASASTARTNLGVAIGTDVQAYSSVLAGTTASFTTADETKLDGIEAGATADQTAQEIATAIDADATAEATLKSALGLGTAAYTASTDYATAAQGALADSAVQPSDNISGLTNDSGYITGNQTITLSGDVSGSGTTSISVTVADDSHNHVISNVDGLQTALDGKQATGDYVVATGDSMTGNLSFGDNDKAIFGAGSDLQIYHDGSNSFIDDAGTGDLYVRADNDLYLDSTDGTARYAQFTKGGAATLRYNNATKLATTSTGIDVTGTVTADGLTVDELTYPSTDGTAGQVLKTDGSGNISFSDAADLTAETRHSIRPSLLLDFANSKTLDPRIDFTRSSTATYYDGKTFAKAEENLVTRSQVFDNADWGLNGSVSVTANDTAAPDGTTNADLISNSSATGFNYFYQPKTLVVGDVYTASIYVKNNDAVNSWLRFRNATNSGSIVLNWSGATLSSLTEFETVVSSSFSSVGNDWYRVVFTITAAEASSRFRVYPSDAGDSSAIGSIYVWGAQLEQRDSVTAYTPTTDQPITNYIPVLQTAASGAARFDHDPVTGESKGLLIEEQRTNLFTYSEDFSNSAWQKQRTSVDSNTIIAPDGTLTGDKLVESTDGSSHFVGQNITGTADTYTFSIYAKAGERDWIAVRLWDGSSYAGFAYFNLANGTIGTITSGTATITSIGNGWYRCSVSGLLTTASNCGAYPAVAFEDNNVAYTGDGYSGVYIWGAQVEEGEFPTSYIPTSGSQVTRLADEASMTGTNFSDWYRQDEGTLYADYSVSHDTVNFGTCPFTIKDSGSTNAITMQRGFSASYTNSFVRLNDTNTSMIAKTTTTPSGNYKHTNAYAVDDFAAAFNGDLLGTDTSGVLPVVDRMLIGGNRATVFSSQTIKKLAYYPARLTNAEIVALTED